VAYGESSKPNYGGPNEFVYSTTFGAQTIPAIRTKSRNDFVFSVELDANEYYSSENVDSPEGDRNNNGKQDAFEIWESVQVLATPRMVQVAGDPTYGATKINRSKDTFTVKFNIAKFEPLIKADWETIGHTLIATGACPLRGIKRHCSPIPEMVRFLLPLFRRCT
jgi:hypothetical protein